MMETTSLGATGLTVSVAGLGCGGNSRVGLGKGASTDEAARLVRAALDEGVSFLDTAAAYGTETVVGRAVAEAGRDRAVISTKSLIRDGGRLLEPAEVVANLEASLRRLRTDHVDVFCLHAVTPDIYGHARDHVLPVLLRQVETGKIRHIGITESAPRDPRQRMLDGAVADNSPWEVMMLAYSMINFGADRELLPAMRKNRIGSLLMFVVRNIFSDAAVLRRTLGDLAAAGRIAEDAAGTDRPLDFLVHAGGAESLTDAAYRFARHQSGGDVVLFGTGDVGHLKANVKSILAPPLPEDDVTRLRALFGGLAGVGLDLPDRRKTPPGAGR